MSRLRFSTLWCVVLLVVMAACQAAPATPASTTVATTVPVQELTAFSSKVYKLPMTVNFGRDWHVSDDFTDLVTVDSRQQDWDVSFNLVTNAQLADPANGHLIPFPQDFVAWLKSDPDFKLGRPTPVSVAGINRLQIDATPVWTSTTTNKKAFLLLRLTGWNIVTKPERWRFILLDNVNGERVLILLIAHADQFDEAAQQAQKILDSIVFAN